MTENEKDYGPHEVRSKRDSAWEIEVASPADKFWSIGGRHFSEQDVLDVGGTMKFTGSDGMSYTIHVDPATREPSEEGNATSDAGERLATDKNTPITAKQGEGLAAKWKAKYEEAKQHAADKTTTLSKVVNESLAQTLPKKKGAK